MSQMDVSTIKAVVGTNSWGSAVYGKMLRGESVDAGVLKETFECAKEKDVAVFDLAQDYGLGKAQKIFGSFGTDGVIISSKFTPTGRYKEGQVSRRNRSTNTLRQRRISTLLTFTGFIFQMISKRILLK